MTTKTVVLFVDYWEDGNLKKIVESTEVGSEHYYKMPSKFISEMSKSYRDASKGVHQFTITNVIIG